VDLRMYLVVLVRCVVGASLILAGISKLHDRPKFRNQIENYQIVGRSIASLIAQSLPSLEISVGAGVTFRILAPWMDVAALGLFLSFAFAIGFNLARGRRDFDCGCFGQHGGRTVSWTTFLRSAILTGLAALTLLAKNPSVPRFTFREQGLVLLTLLWMISMIAIGATVLQLSSSGHHLKEIHTRGPTAPSATRHSKEREAL
jgi:uncharacterized membrane protein YphA (DoxX/SURF4 family)